MPSPRSRGAPFKWGRQTYAEWTPKYVSVLTKVGANEISHSQSRMMLLRVKLTEWI